MSQKPFAAFSCLNMATIRTLTPRNGGIMRPWIASVIFASTLSLALSVAVHDFDKSFPVAQCGDFRSEVG
jgi:hypothetical protein